MCFYYLINLNNDLLTAPSPCALYAPTKKQTLLNLLFFCASIKTLQSSDTETLEKG